MAALRQLLNRGLLAGRRAATAPPRATSAFSTTTTVVGRSHVPQYRQPPIRSPNLDILARSQFIWEHVDKIFGLHRNYPSRLTAGLLLLNGSYCLSGHVASYLSRSSKSPSHEIK
nr:uncharacterized protein LOC127309179 [Lolium perenne]